MSNLKTIIFSLIVLFCTQISWSHEFPCGDVDSNWKDCTSDSECILIFDACALLVAYNKKFLEKIDIYYKCLSNIIECAQPLKRQNKSLERAFCKNKKCALIKR